MIKHLKPILIIILFLPSLLLSADWADTFPIHIYGDVAFIATIYEFIKAVVTDDAVEKIVTVGFSITAFVAGFKLKDGDVQGFGKSIIAPITLLALFFTPSVNVKIVDLRADKGFINYQDPSGGYAEVDSVPYAIAFLPASAMLLVNLTIDLIDNNWDSVEDANKFSSIGFLELAGGMEKALAITTFIDANNSNGAKYEYDAKLYLRECIMKKAFSNSSNQSSFYSTKETYPELLNPAKFPVNFGDELISYTDYNNSYVPNQKCSDAYTTLISAHSTEVIEIMKNKIDKMNPTKDFTSVEASKGFTQYIGDANKKIGNVQTAATTTVIGKFLERQQGIDSVGVDGYTMAKDLSIDTTLANMRSEGPSKLAWVANVLPKSIAIITGILIAAFPFLIIVQSFMGATAFSAIANYFMGFFAFYFNLVALALVQNIISFYTAQQAQETIVNFQGMPFSINHISDFMIQQADMTGIAGIVGVASIFALTPLIFYGEMKGFSAAIGSVSGMFNGNIGATASDTLKRGALEAEIDRQLLEEQNGLTEAQASKWLSGNGYSGYTRAGVSALDTYNQIMQGYNAIGAGLTAQDLMHSDNVPAYSRGAYLQSTQQAMKQVGMGDSIDSVRNAGDVAMQDGQVMAESINASHELRGNGYNTKNIGYGNSMQQFAKDMGSDFTGSQGLEATNALVAGSVNQSAQQLASGEGLLKTGAFGSDGKLLNNTDAHNLMNAYEAQSLGSAKQNIGFGSKVNLDSMASKSYQDGQVQGQTVNDTAKIRKDRDYDVDNIALGSAASQYAKDMSMDEIAKKMKEKSATSKDNNKPDNLEPDTVPTPQDIESFMKKDNTGNKRKSVTNSGLLNSSFNDGSLQLDTVNGLLDKYGKDLSNHDLKELKGLQNALSSKSVDENTTKDVAEALVGAVPDALSSMIAGSRDQSLKQIAGGEGLIRSGGFDASGNFVSNDLYQGYVGNALKGASNTIGFGDKANFNAIKETSFEDGQIAASNASEINTLRNSKSINGRTGKSIGWNTEDIARGQALDSVGKEFGAIAKDNAVSGKEENRFMQGNFTSGRVDANKTMGVGNQYSEGAMSLVQAGSHMQLIGSVASTDGQLSGIHDSQNAVARSNAIDMKNQKLQQNINRLQDKIDNNESDNVTADQAKIKKWKSMIQDAPDVGENAGMGYYEITKTNAQAQMSAQIGQANANKQLLEDGGGIITQNAQYGTLSQALTTDAKIQTQGGVANTLNTDVSEAQMKAAAQQGATLGQIQEYAQKAGMSASAAKQFSEEIINGAKAGSEMISRGITDAAKDVALAMSAGKTGSDIISIDRADEKYEDGGFVGLQKDNSQITTDQKIGTTRGLLTLADSQKEGSINNIRDKAYADSIARGQAVDNDFKRAGLLNDDGTVNADNWVSGKSYLQANNLMSHNALVAGGAVFSGAVGEKGMSSIQMSALNKIDSGTEFNSHAEGRVLEEAAKILVGPNASNQEIQAKAFELAKDKHLSHELRSGAIDYGAMSAQQAAKALLEKTGNSVEGEGGSIITGGLTTMATVLGLSELTQRMKNYSEGKFTADKDFTYQSGVDKEGNPIYDTRKAGDKVNINSNEGLKEYFENNRGDFSVQGGTASNLANKVADKFTNLTDKFRGVSPEASSDTINSSETSNKTETQNKHNSEVNYSAQSTPPNNDKGSITNPEQDVKKNVNLSDSGKERKFEAIEGWAKEQKAEVVEKYKSDIDKLTQPYTTKEMQADKEALNESFRKQSDSLANQYMSELNKAGSADERKAIDDKFAQKNSRLNDRFTALNNAYDAKLNQSLPSHVIEAKETLYSDLQERIQSIDAQKNNMKMANPQSFVQDVPNQHITASEPVPVGHKDFGKYMTVSNGIKAGIGSNFAMDNLMQYAMGQETDVSKLMSGNASKGRDAIANTLSSATFGLSDSMSNLFTVTRDQFSNIYKQGQHFDGSKIAYAMGQIPTTMLNDVAGLGNSIVSAGQAAFQSGGFVDNFKNNFSQHSGTYSWLSQHASQTMSQQIASINPHSGAITPNYSHQGANNPFANNTAQITADNNSEIKSINNDMSYGIEEMNQKIESFMEMLRADNQRR